ncbi:NitT/TauT family transport system permease protein [Mobilisporobacter senegalensis]|uniref:NitT/TauT family transport system permease protein n=1 Tax=Mobilisporobacter senegalensis TaxID=1329262 RepID=A0A3N1XNI1_9FIRM|nr:ABC transporter permease subunit [Mobilisporobacter senegalensis]ROR28206.1 NitT/TauT family transport system permease protein [Mobilisporobacter senegalensis]
MTEKKNSFRLDLRVFIPIESISLALVLNKLLPTNGSYTQKEYPYFTYFLILLLAIFIVIAVITAFNKSFQDKIVYKSWFIGAAFFLLNIYNLATIKFMVIPNIYFPSPEMILKVFIKDWAFLLKCLGYSGKLLLTGYGSGAVLGIITGILVGWSKGWNYWINPVIKVIGPIPSTAWVPIALVAFPTSFTASVFLIGLAVWFPTTVLTSSGISSVKQAYFEVSSTLGASTIQNIFKVAVPSAMPSIFIGIFNGTCSSFLTLMTAEMLGVKYGVGWYINWQKDMLSYPNVYAGLITIAVTFSLLITLLFKVRDKILGWQKGVIKW